MNSISLQDLQDWENQGKEFLLIDVREDFEREHFHIGGVHIALGELHRYMDTFTPEQCLVFYCAKGIRSGIAVQRLMERGLNNLYNLSGGIHHLYP